MFKAPTKNVYKKSHLYKLKRLLALPIIQVSQIAKMQYVVFCRFSIARVLTDKQVASMRRFMFKSTLRVLHIKYFCYPTKMRTAKPAEVRMGKGKGAFSDWIATLQSGSLFCRLLFSPLLPAYLVYDIIYAVKYKLYAGLIFDYRF